MATYKKTPKKSIKNISRMILGTVLVIGIGAGSLYKIEQYNNPALYGNWVSEQTGEKILFNEDGTVSLSEAAYIPTFQVISPNKMLYLIEDKQFEMYYRLDGRNLEWGASQEEVESFERK